MFLVYVCVHGYRHVYSGMCAHMYTGQRLMFSVVPDLSYLIYALTHQFD